MNESALVADEAQRIEPAIRKKSTLVSVAPQLAALLRIVECERGWFPRTGWGACHPALVCARVHGERLGRWEVAVGDAVGARVREKP